MRPGATRTGTGSDGHHSGGLGHEAAAPPAGPPVTDDRRVLLGPGAGEAGAAGRDEELDRVRADLTQHQAALASAIETIGHLQEALQTNRRISMAIGVLMERDKLTAEQAFDRLREASSRGNIKLRDLAEHALYTGQTP